MMAILNNYKFRNMRFHKLNFCYFNSKSLLFAIATLPLFVGGCKKENNNLPKKPDFHLNNGQINASNNAVLATDGTIVCAFRDNVGLPTLLKTTVAGEHIFHKPISLPLSLNQPVMAISGDGSIFIATQTYRNFSLTKYDILLVKCNNSGDTLWTRIYGGAADELPTNIKRTKDGGIMLIARALTDSNTDIWLIKLDAAGNDVWNTLNRTSGASIPTDFLEASSGEIYLSGFSNNGSTYMARLNAAGQLLNQHPFAVGSFGFASSIVECSDGSLLILAYDGTDVNLVKADNNCQQIWIKKIGYSDHNENGTAMVKNTDGSVTAVGYCTGPNTNQTNDVLAIKISEDGDPIWYRAFGAKNSDIAYDIVKDADGNNVVVGITNSFTNNFTYQLFTVWMDDNGTFK
jgi:hypothetical protein